MRTVERASPPSPPMGPFSGDYGKYRCVACYLATPLLKKNMGNIFVLPRWWFIYTASGTDVEWKNASLSNSRGVWVVIFKCCMLCTFLPSSFSLLTFWNVLVQCVEYKFMYSVKSLWISSILVTFVAYEKAFYSVIACGSITYRIHGLISTYAYFQNCKEIYA